MNKMNQELLIINVWICQIEGNSISPVFGGIFIRERKIESIFRGEGIPNSLTNQNCKVIEGSGRVVTIPNVNFHDHFYSRLAKGLDIKGSTENFPNILENLWWKLDLLLDEEMVRASAVQGAADSIKNGVTYIFDHHASPTFTSGSLKTISDVLTEYNLRGVLCFESSSRNGDEMQRLGLEENLNFHKRHTNDDIKALFGLHASFTLNDELIKRASELVNENKMGIHIHLCEDKSDKELSIAKFGKSSLQRLIDHNLLSEKSILAHGVHLSGSEIDQISNSGASIVFNPDSNMNNAVGLPDYDLMISKISTLAGTDGMHANVAKSIKQIFLLMRNAGYSFDKAFGYIIKIYFDQLNFVKKYFPDFTSLQLGERADLIMWDYIPPTLFNSGNFWGHYLYGMTECGIHSVVQNGEVLLENFKLNEEVDLKFIAEQGKILLKKFNNS